VPDRPEPGRSLVTRRAIIDLVRAATLDSYGVVGLASGHLGRLRAWLGFACPGVRVHLGNGFSVELDLVVAHGLPVAEVARQVDSAVRYAIRRSLGREIDSLSIHVDGLRVEPLTRQPEDLPATTRPPAGLLVGEPTRLHRRPGRDAA
jgi:uncharacterized alkaline shock family protein YloU